MVNIIKKNKELFILIGIILALAICIEFPSWLKGGYFVGGGDIKTQWYPFYVLNRRETINAIKSGSLPFYSWVLFLGNNIWASKMSYGFVDIFNLLFYIFKNDYFWIYDLQIILKLLIAGITFYLFIDYSLNNKKAALFAGLLYSSSSYLLYFTSQSSFISVVALAPLYMLGIERFLKENKGCLFSISVALLLLTNYYIFFSLTIISPFYFLYRYYNVKGNFNNVFINVIKIILYYFVGLLISAIFILPAFFYVLQNERVGYINSGPFIYSDIKIYLNVLLSFLTPSDLYIYGNNVFNFDSHELKEVCIYTSAFVVLLLPQIFNSKNKKFKNSTLLFYIVFALFLFIPYFSSVMNGFSSICFRWTYILSMFNIFIAVQILFINGELSKKLLLFSFGCISILILLFYFLGLIINESSILMFSDQLYICLLTIGFLGLYSFCLLKNNKLLIFVLIIELLFHGFAKGIDCVEDRVSKAEIDELTNVLFNPKTEVINEYLHDLDPENEGEFYRIYVPYDSLYWDFSRNMNLIYGFNGTMSYDSTYEPSFADMININNDGIVQIIYWDFDITNPDLLNFISCKYAFTIDESEIPFNNYQILDSNYLNGIIISKNLDYRAIGETYNIRASNANGDFSKLNTTIISEDSSIDKYLVSKNLNKLENIEYGNNKMSGTISTDNNSFVVLKLSYDDGFKIKVNDNYVDTYKCNGGMIGFPVEKGINNVFITFVPKGFNEGCIMSIAGVLLLICMFFKDKIIYLIKKQHN